MAAHKTKAALQSRSCRFTASNSSFQDITVIDQVNSEAGNPASVMYTALSGEAEQPDLLGSIQNRLSFSESVLPVTDSHAQKILTWSLVGYGHKESAATFFSKSRANFRWRRLISFLAAATKKLAVLSPPSFRFSIFSITSWGIRTVVICDFAFFEPVAISSSPSDRCISVYAKKNAIKALKCISLEYSFKKEVTYTYESAKPGSATTLTGLLTTTLVGVTIMAELQSTQTRPVFALTYNTKFFTWRFLAVPVSHPEARPIVLYTNAHTEAEARQSLPGWLLFFAARLPLFTPEIKGVNRA